MAPSKDYEQGKRNGATKATLQGLASTLDRLEDRIGKIGDRLNRLPCQQHTASLAWNWRVTLAMVSGIVAVAVWILKEALR